MINALKNVLKSESKQQLEKAVFEAAAIAGCSYFCYLPALPRLPDNKIIRNFPDSWVEYYQSNNLHTIDLSFEIAATGGRCFYLSDLQSWIKHSELRDTFYHRRINKFIERFQELVSPEAFFIPTGRNVEQVPTLCIATAHNFDESMLTEVKALAYTLHLVIDRVLHDEMGLEDELAIADVFAWLGQGLDRSEIIIETELSRRKVAHIIDLLIHRYAVENQDELAFLSAKNSDFSRHLIDSIKASQNRSR